MFPVEIYIVTAIKMVELKIVLFGVQVIQQDKTIINLIFIRMQFYELCNA